MKKKLFSLFRHGLRYKMTLLDQFSRIVEINQSKINLKKKYCELSFYPIFKRLVPKSSEKQLLLKKNSKKILT